MNKLVTLLASLTMSANVLATLSNIPEMPLNESPSVDATEVSKLPRLQASTPSDTIAEAQWLVFPKSDVQLIGGFLSEEVYYVADYAQAGKQLVELGYEIQLNNATANAIWVYPNAIVELVNTTQPNTVIARIDMEFDTTAVVADENEFILFKTVKEGDEVVETRIEWHLQDSGFTPEWDTKIQAIISKQQSFLAVKVEDNDLNAGIWVSSNMDSNIGFSGMATENNYTSATGFANTLKQSNYSQFSLACVFTAVSTDCDRLTVLNTPDVTAIEKPELQIFVNDSSEYQLTSALNPNTEYEYQVRYFTEKVGNYAASHWSQATSFTTQLLTEYEFQSRHSSSVMAGTNETFEYRITNRGEDAGENVSIQFMLPFNALNHVNGTLADFYSATLNNETCAINISEGKTYFMCNAETFSSGSHFTLKVDAYIPTDVADTLNIYYMGCDSNCSSKTMMSEPVRVLGNFDADEDSSESGGSMFWMLLGLPLLLRRKG